MKIFQVLIIIVMYNLTLQCQIVENISYTKYNSMCRCIIDGGQIHFYYYI